MTDYAAETNRCEATRAHSEAHAGDETPQLGEPRPYSLRRKRRIVTTAKIRLEAEDARQGRAVMRAYAVNSYSELVRQLVRQAYTLMFAPEVRTPAFDGAAGAAGDPPLPEVPR